MVNLTAKLFLPKQMNRLVLVIDSEIKFQKVFLSMYRTQEKNVVVPLITPARKYGENSQEVVQKFLDNSTSKFILYRGLINEKF